MSAPSIASGRGSGGTRALALAGVVAAATAAVMPFAVSRDRPLPASAALSLTRAAARRPPLPAPPPRASAPPVTELTAQPDPRRGPALGANLPVAATTAASFQPLYWESARRFSVNWLLIASIHRQETSFSTARGTYRGLNFAHCCAGPMQFNVTDGPPSTWERFKTGYVYGVRPASYPHQTASHPSVYDDFDAIMAGAWLLRANGAGMVLDGSAWGAAYEYYGGGLDGVDYADQVMARAIGWARHGMCTNCGVDPRLVAEMESQYGAAFRAPLLAAERAAARERRLKQHQRSRRARAAGAGAPRGA